MGGTPGVGWKQDGPGGRSVLHQTVNIVCLRAARSNLPFCGDSACPRGTERRHATAVFLTPAHLPVERAVCQGSWSAQGRGVGEAARWRDYQAGRCTLNVADPLPYSSDANATRTP